MAPGSLLEFTPDLIGGGDERETRRGNTDRYGMYS
jgi:hypothetical protein